MSDRDWAWIEAAKEVDALAPAAPPLYQPSPPRCHVILPRGWRYEVETQVYIDPRGGRIEREFVEATPGGAQAFFTKQARDLADILQMAASQQREAGKP